MAHGRASSSLAFGTKLTFKEVHEPHETIRFFGVFSRLFVLQVPVKTVDIYNTNRVQSRVYSSCKCTTQGKVKNFSRSLESKHLRGRLFSRSAASTTIFSVILWKLVPLGKYCRSRSLPFSFTPRCYGECGRRKYVLIRLPVPFL